MKYLITGSGGFLGTNLTQALLDQGHHVVGVDNYCTGQRANTERFLDHPHFRFVEHDVSRGGNAELDAALDPVFGGPLSWVLHLASLASPPDYQRFPIETLMVGAEGTRHMLELARAHGAGLLLASTSEVYGDPDVHPQREDYWGNVNPVGPRSCYDESKRYAEALTMAYHREHGVDTRIIRIFNTYGPFMRADDGRVITNFINQALRGEPLTVYGDGSQTRSFQYVDDWVAAVLKLLEVPYHKPINIGNPDEYTIRELAEAVRAMIDPDLDIAYRPMPVDDPKRRRPDIGAAQRELQWRPRVPLSEGLQRTVEYFRQRSEVMVPAMTPAQGVAAATD